MNSCIKNRLNDRVIMPQDRKLHEWANTEWIYFNFTDAQRGIDGTFIYCGNERMIIINNYSADELYVLNERGTISYQHDTLFFQADSSADTVFFTDSNVSVTSRGNHSIYMDMQYSNTVFIEETGKLILWDSLCYYYSYPDMIVEADIECEAYTGRFEGKGWLDHQWGKFLPGSDYAHIWFSIILDDDSTNIMAWAFEDDIKSHLNIFSSEFSKSDNATIQPMVWYTSDESGKVFPYGWYISDKANDLKLLAMPSHKNYETPEIYQGSGTIQGYMKGEPVSGQFFMEYTGGYNKKRVSVDEEKYISVYRNSVEAMLDMIDREKTE